MGMGTNRLTNTPANVQHVLAATNAGIALVDTAHLYTGGESERTIGSAGPTGALVATKGGYRPGEGAPAVLRYQIEQSLTSLRTHTIDLDYLHRVDPQTPLEDSLRVIREYVDAGRIRLVGLSQVTVAEIERARAIVPIAAVQSHYNLSQRGWDHVIDYCEREGIVFVPYFPLGGDHPRLAEIAARHVATTAQIALAWLLHRSPQILPIPGTLSLEHARQNVAALDIELSEEEVEMLTSA
jgi:aryl-alcohol dehydrogenase-like predicted oxidoreductase